jgi:GAF domain-containing protein
MTSRSPALQILHAGTRALTRDDGLERTLLGMLHPLADQLGIASAAVFTSDGPGGGLEIAASIGLRDPAALASAVRNPAHPVARTAAEGAIAFDVRPLAPGGPALRSHLPLTVVEDGHELLLGVLALAHDQPLDGDGRAIAEVVADLAAIAIERERASRRPA